PAPCSAAGRRAHPDDPGGDRDHLRSRPGQSAGADDHGERVARDRRTAGGPSNRRGTVLRDLRRDRAERDQGGDPAPAMTQLPVQPAWRLAECPEQRRWLVDQLWSEDAVGIIGGEPKCCKSFLALDLAVAVAAGTPCLRRFAVARPGRVLLYPAEDALHVVRQRLDLEADRARLEETVATLKPRLLILDPFVRLHRIDENVSGEVAPLLAFLRELQRRHATAIAVVHHARKGAGTVRAGQALRGSSEFHAWGDSNLYLRRDSDDRIALSVEHRAAAAIAGITLELTQRD